jgi:hypothetical protein
MVMTLCGVVQQIEWHNSCVTASACHYYCHQGVIIILEAIVPVGRLHSRCLVCRFAMALHLISAPASGFEKHTLVFIALDRG